MLLKTGGGARVRYSNRLSMQWSTSEWLFVWLWRYTIYIRLNSKQNQKFIALNVAACHMFRVVYLYLLLGFLGFTFAPGEFCTTHVPLPHADVERDERTSFNNLQRTIFPCYVFRWPFSFNNIVGAERYFRESTQCFSTKVVSLLVNDNEFYKVSDVLRQVDGTR